MEALFLCPFRFALFRRISRLELIFERFRLNENAGGDYIYLHAIKSLVSSNADVCNESQLKEALAYNNINIRLTADITLNERMYISDGKTLPWT